MSDVIILYAVDEGSESIFHYEVVGDKGILMVVKSLSCIGHEPCLIQLNKVSDGIYVFGKMVNNKEEILWHSNKKYYVDRDKCILDYYLGKKSEFLWDIEEYKKLVDSNQIKIDSFLEKIKNVGVIKRVRKNIQIDDKLYYCDRKGRVKSCVVDAVINGRDGISYLVNCDGDTYEVKERDFSFYSEEKGFFYLSKKEALKSYLESEVKKLYEVVDETEKLIKEKENFVSQIDDYIDKNYKNYIK